MTKPGLSAWLSVLDELAIGRDSMLSVSPLSEVGGAGTIRLVDLTAITTPMLDDTDTPADTTSITSAVPQLEPSSHLTCCCQQDDCSNFKAWKAIILRLENNFILSAEAGQALLQHYDALRLLHQDCSANNEDHDHQFSELLDKNHSLEKTCLLVDTDTETQRNLYCMQKLDLALINNEAAEASAFTLHRELDEARATITRLSANHVDVTTLGTRLSRLNGELDDMQQERDIALIKVSVNESKLKLSMEKASELHSENRRLRKELRQKDQLHMDSNESLLQGAKSKIQKLALNATFGSTATSTLENAELTKALETVYGHNENLKRHNDELQALLADAQDEIFTMREEVQVHLANPPIQRLLESNEDQKTWGASTSSLKQDTDPLNPLIPDPCAYQGNEEQQGEPPIRGLSEFDRDEFNVQIEPELPFVERSMSEVHDLKGQITIDPKSKANESLKESIGTTTLIVRFCISNHANQSNIL
ncbi:hypothetical protein C8R41DRAFT_919743 [Lentinula lateritia]|uniref:Uncharacterized protein n=1 Tax=Lentinula lateritia TaxID=40482 RepID=A0ABQ8VG89_9AGAR|nr:hypothetical protein C8R41DRAFT_919743 [Lentinula lateritia]